jgi:hypothetical protein
VTSWREGLSERAQRDLEELTDSLLDFAGEQLNKRGGFFAFGASFSGDSDEVQTFMLAAGNDHPDARQHLAETWDGLREQHDGLRAVGVASDVRIQGGGDAVRVEFECVEGIALEIVTPYRVVRTRGLKKNVAFSESSVSDGDRRLWL